MGKISHEGPSVETDHKIYRIEEREFDKGAVFGIIIASKEACSKIK